MQLHNRLASFDCGAIHHEESSHNISRHVCACIVLGWFFEGVMCYYEEGGVILWSFAHPICHRLLSSLSVSMQFGSVTDVLRACLDQFIRIYPTANIAEADTNNVSDGVAGALTLHAEKLQRTLLSVAGCDDATQKFAVFAAMATMPLVFKKMTWF